MNAILVSGTVKDGVIIPDEQAGLAEGSRVRILSSGDEPYPGFWSEFSAWDQLSDEAWAMIDKWEHEEKS